MTPAHRLAVVSRYMLDLDAHAVAVEKLIRDSLWDERQREEWMVEDDQARDRAVLEDLG